MAHREEEEVKPQRSREREGKQKKSESCESFSVDLEKGVRTRFLHASSLIFLIEEHKEIVL